MLLGLILIFTVIALLLFLYLCPIRLIIHFLCAGDNVTFNLYGGVGFIKFNLMPVLSSKKKRKDQPAPSHKKGFSFCRLEESLSKGVEMLRYLKKKLTICSFSLKSRFSLGDAADTGIATGAAYGTIYNILGLCDQYFVLKKHEVVITPVFQGFGFEADLHCELRLRLLYVIGLVLKIKRGDVK